MVVEGLAAPDLMIAEMQGRALSGQHNAKALLALLKRPCAKGFAVEMEEVEQEKDESIAVTGVRCVLDQAERGRAVGWEAIKPDRIRDPYWGSDHKEARNLA
jgi:hypothetical protein